MSVVLAYMLACLIPTIQVLGEETEQIKDTLARLGIYLKPSCYELDIKPLIRVVFATFFGQSTSFVDMCVKKIPDPRSGAVRKVERYFTGPLDSKIAENMIKCNPNGPLVLHIVKLYPTLDRSRFDAYGRILSGKLEVGQKVRVLGEGYTVDDEEDMSIQEVTKIWVYESRYRFEVPSATAGNWVLVSGIDESIVKTATVVATRFPKEEDAYIFRPIHYPTISALKVAIEPLNPTELPKMLEGLRKINKSYPLVTTRVEESGEHILLGTGEMYLDCIMHDLRSMYAEIEIRISDPVVKFCETVVETSSLKCFAETPNRKYVLELSLLFSSIQNAGFPFLLTSLETKSQ